jgi:hypothetical protein
MIKSEVGTMTDRKEYLNNYHKNNYKRIPLDVSKQKYNEIKDHAAGRSETVNGFIKRAIDETIVSDNEKYDTGK